MRMQAVVRVEQSQRLLDGLVGGIGDWVGRRVKADRLRQYSSQLQVLNATLRGALEHLRCDLNEAEAADVGHAFALCRICDQRVALVRRVFEYYRTKFDQRDDPALGPILRAADEVVWSCWAQPFRKAADRDPNMVRPPAPLPYLEPSYSPSALPRDDPPPDLAPEADSALVAFLGKLPIPLISLPTLCAGDPWWLVLIAHEAGHHLEFDLAGEWKLVSDFADLVERSAVGAPDPGLWRRWSQEIFADLCSVYQVGPAAIRAILQLELDTEERMLTSARAKYPPPMVRLALLAGAADAAGVPGTAALRPIVIGSGTLPARWCDYLTAQLDVAKAVLDGVSKADLAGLGTLLDLLEWAPEHFRPGGTVAALKEGLLGRAPLYVNRSATSPRLVAAAAAAAWDEVSALPNADMREAGRVRLAAVVPAAIVSGREEGTRAPERVGGVDVALVIDDVTALLRDRVQFDGFVSEEP